MSKIIIHTDTRVVRRVTSLSNPELFPDESAVDFQGSVDIALPQGQLAWKLDAQNQLVAASYAEALAAGVEEALEIDRGIKRQAFKTSVNSLIQNLDAATLAQAKALIKELFVKWRDLNG